MREAPAKAIQDLAGHADLTTMTRYMHLSPASLNQAIQLPEQPENRRGKNGARAPSSEANVRITSRLGASPQRFER
jgi:hypothetical protein